MIFFPLKLSFFYLNNDLSWLLVAILLDVIFLFDIILNFFSAYFNNEEKLVDKKQQIACNYLRSWFLVDLLSVLPFHYIFQIGIFDFFKFLRVLRIGRIIKNLK